MVKSSKKTEAKSAGKESTASGKPPAAKKPTAAKGPSAPPAAPLIDTSLAAESAAKMLAAGINLKSLKPAASTNQPAKPESSTFKQIKAGSNKPHATTMSNLLDKTHGPGAGGQIDRHVSKQVGQNQTFGADVTRTGVPRRTSG